MSKLSLYRKYRPHNFENLVGQDHVKQILINALKLNQIAHAYIFAGPRGTGKTSTARLIAKALNCQNLKDDFEPCGKCEFCTDIASGRLIDLIEIDAASNRGIEEIRDLKEKINFSPTRSKYKIYIIDEVHMLTNFAFNALLKTLEEPPSHSFFILATTELHKIPETIISRCQNFDFKRISNEDLQKRMRFISNQEGIKISDSSLEIISRYVNGGMRDAISILEQISVNEDINDDLVLDMLGMSSLKMLNDFYETVFKQDTEGSLKIVKKLYEQGADLKNFMSDFISVLRDKMLECINLGKSQYVFSLMKLIDIFNEEKLKSYPLAQLSLEIAVIKSTFKENTLGNKKDLSVKDSTVLMKSVEKKSTKKSKEVRKTVIEKKETLENVEKSKETYTDGKSDSFEGNASLDSIKNQWVDVLGQINKPSFKRSLENGSPVKLEGNTLILSFLSNFHRDKIMSEDSRAQIEGAIKSVTGSNLKVDGIVNESKKAEVLAKIKKSNEAKSSSKNSVRLDQNKGSISDALDVFGGELV